MPRVISAPALAIALLFLVACGDDDDGGASRPSALTPQQLVGTWGSEACEAYPSADGSVAYLLRSYEVDASRWRVGVAFHADEACQMKLFSYNIEGSYTLGSLSSRVPAATEAVFAFERVTYTAQSPQAVALLTSAGCGQGAWAVGETKDVSATGCLLSQAVSACPAEYDLLKLDGDLAYAGRRPSTGDLCAAERRPTELGYPIRRQSGQ